MLHVPFNTDGQYVIVSNIPQKKSPVISRSMKGVEGAVRLGLSEVLRSEDFQPEGPLSPPQLQRPGRTEQ